MEVEEEIEEGEVRQRKCKGRKRGRKRKRKRSGSRRRNQGRGERGNEGGGKEKELEWRRRRKWRSKKTDKTPSGHSRCFKRLLNGCFNESSCWVRLSRELEMVCREVLENPGVFSGSLF